MSEINAVELIDLCDSFDAQFRWLMIDAEREQHTGTVSPSTALTENFEACVKVANRLIESANAQKIESANFIESLYAMDLRTHDGGTPPAVLILLDRIRQDASAKEAYFRTRRLIAGRLRENNLDALATAFEKNEIPNDLRSLACVALATTERFSEASKFNAPRLSLWAATELIARIFPPLCKNIVDVGAACDVSKLMGFSIEPSPAAAKEAMAALRCLLLLPVKPSDDANASRIATADLTDRHKEILKAMTELKATDERNRKTAEAIVRRVGAYDANAFKAPMAELVRNHLIQSKTGRQGGAWLTEAGMAIASQLP
jgi:hypothetical protein